MLYLANILHKCFKAICRRRKVTLFVLIIVISSYTFSHKIFKVHYIFFQLEKDNPGLNIRHRPSYKEVKTDNMSLSLNGVKDISALKGTNFKYLYFMGTQSVDISALKGMPLILLRFWGTQIVNISALKGMPLLNLTIIDTPVVDISALKGMPLNYLDLSKTKVVDISALKGMPLQRLNLSLTKIVDISALKGMPLEEVNLPWTAENIEFLKLISVVKGRPPKSHETLYWINDCDAHDFWLNYDATQRFYPCGAP